MQGHANAYYAKLAERTFETTQFKEEYDRMPVPEYQVQYRAYVYANFS